MPTVPLTTEKLQEAIAAVEKHGTVKAAAAALGIDDGTFRHRYKKALNAAQEGTLERECAEHGVSVDDVPYYWLKTPEVSMLVKRPGAGMSYGDMRDEIIADMDAHSPVYAPIKHEPGEHLLVVDPADVHIGKLSRIFETGHDYDMTEAVRRVREGVSGLLAKSIPFGVAKIVFVIGNDILHIDTPKRMTTGGTPQDTDGQWWQMFQEAKRCYVAVIEQLTQVADVHLVFCPSNHDYQSGWMLADSLYSWFRLNPNVHFGDDQRSISIAHRKYVEFGLNLIGFTHGDGAKEKDLPSIMQYEAREQWGRSRHAAWYVHHTHHKQRNVYGADAQKREKDLTGITVLQAGKTINPANNVYVETVRTPSPPDGWHDRQAYLNTQAVEVFLHHPQDGPIARFTHNF